MSRTGSIYALTTPRGTPFYVGATVQSVGTRVGQHIRDARHGRKGSQVHEMLAATRRVGIWVLEADIPAHDLGRRERRHKRRLEREGFEMLNYHHGANGCLLQSEKVRQRIAKHAAKRLRGPGGQFLPQLFAPMAGGAPDPDQLF